MGALELIEAGRRHVATGRVPEALSCLERASEDPDQGAEALSLLAAAHLLTAARRPDHALAAARRVACHPRVERQQLVRCAVVSLCAGDLSLAEELAGRAWSWPPDEAAAVLATARLRRGDRAAVGRILTDTPEAAGAAPFWRRLLVEALALGWRREALYVWRAMRRGHVRAPHPAELMVRAAPPLLFFAVLLSGVVTAVAAPSRVLAAVGLGVLLVAGGAAAGVDLAEARWVSALSGVTLVVATAAATLLRWHL